MSCDSVAALIHKEGPEKWANSLIPICKKNAKKKCFEVCSSAIGGGEKCSACIIQSCDSPCMSCMYKNQSPALFKANCFSKTPPVHAPIHAKIAHNANRINSIEYYIENHKFFLGAGALVILIIVLYVFMGKKSVGKSK